MSEFVPTTPKCYAGCYPTYVEHNVICIMFMGKRDHMTRTVKLGLPEILTATPSAEA